MDATAAWRPRPPGRSPPPLDPLTRDYAAWRSRSLRWSCLAVILVHALGAWSGKAFPSVSIGLREPSTLGSWLEWGLNGYLRAITVAYLAALIASAGLAGRLRWSGLLARSAWIIGFLGPMPLFLIPFSRVLGLRGLDAAILDSGAIRTLAGLFIPSLFAMLPALVRSALVVKRFLPETALPGVLIVLSTPVLSLVHFLMICLLVQVAPRRDLILGLAALGLAPMVWLSRAGTLIRPLAPGGGRDPLRLERLAVRVLTLLGLALILREVSEDVDLFSWLEGPEIDFRWALRFMASVLSSRKLLTVTLVDGLLAILYRAHRAEGPAEVAGLLGRKVDALGAALAGGHKTGQEREAGYSTI